MKKITLFITVIVLSCSAHSQIENSCLEKLQDAFREIQQNFDQNNQDFMVEMEMKLIGSKLVNFQKYEDKIKLINYQGSRYFWSKAATIFQDQHTTVNVDEQSKQIYALKTPPGKKREIIFNQYSYMNDTLLRISEMVKCEKLTEEGRELTSITLKVPENRYGLNYHTVVFYLDNDQLYRSKAYSNKGSNYQEIEITFLAYKNNYKPKETLGNPISMVRNTDGTLKTTYTNYSWNDLR